MSRFLIAAGLGLSTILAGCGVSTQQEVQIGQQEAAQANAQLPILNDPAINSYVNAVGQELAHASSRPDLPWTFVVVNTDVVNAFSLPGGYIYVNRGILERADKMDELAAVLAHEESHVVLRHAVKQMQQMQGAQVGVVLGCALLNVCQSQATQAAINVGGAAVFAKFSRTDEKQADDNGLALMRKAGINPTGMLTFFQKLLAEEQANGGEATGVAAWFQDHPGTQDRIADIKQRLTQVPQSELAHDVSNTTAFDAMKRHLAELPPAPKTPSGQ